MIAANLFEKCLAKVGVSAGYAAVREAVTGPKPKCRDVRDLVAIRWENGHEADIANVTRLTQVRHWPRVEVQTLWPFYHLAI